MRMFSFSGGINRCSLELDQLFLPETDGMKLWGRHYTETENKGIKCSILMQEFRNHPYFPKRDRKLQKSFILQRIIISNLLCLQQHALFLNKTLYIHIYQKNIDVQITENGALWKYFSGPQLRNIRAGDCLRATLESSSHVCWCELVKFSLSGNIYRVYRYQKRNSEVLSFAWTLNIPTGIRLILREDTDNVSRTSSTDACHLSSCLALSLSTVRKFRAIILF